MPQPYVSRPEAETFIAALARAIEAPQTSPVVFHLWGIGGVGKSTLLRQVVNTFPQAGIPLVNGLPISFGQTEGIASPADLMEKLHGLLKSQFLDPSLFGRTIRPQPDPFADRYTQYFDAIHQLNTTTPEGKAGASSEQLGLVKQLVKSLTQGGSALATATGNPVVGGALAAASKGTDAMVDGATLALSEKDRLQSLVQSHKATRDQRDLQALLLDPLPHLTQAFVKRLSQWAEQRPIILILDTYEKADLATIDLWLWRTLLSNTDLGRHRIRLVVAGRYNLLKRPEWATVQQNVVQQTSEVVCTYGPEKFTAEQTQDYLAKIGITSPAVAERIYRVTKGWPYYLNKIRETPNLDANMLTQDLAAFLVNHVPPADQGKARQLAQVVACCRWFDGPMVEALAQQLGLVPPGIPENAPSAQGDCLDWLREQTFVEPMAGGRWRLDDVARDVFRMALWQEDRPRFERTHDLLARYFKAKANQAVTAATSTSEKYENPDWLEPMAGHLYHLTFTSAATLQRTWLTHILEANLLKQPELVRSPLQGLTEDHRLDSHPYLAHTTRSFLQRAAPAMTHGWAVLEENSSNYYYNENFLGLSKSAIDRAVETCLQNPDQFDGMAKLAALAYKAMRCLEGQTSDWLQKTQAQAQQLLAKEPANFLAELFCYRLGNSFYNSLQFDQAIACYDAALAIKTDYHEALNNKGNTLYALGREEGALAKLSEGIACYDAALTIKPNDHEALNNKGNALAELGDNVGAIACYDNALAIKSDLHEALNNKGNVLADLGNKVEAIACYDAALKIKPDFYQALYNKGNMLGDLGNRTGAIACYDAALKIKPDLYTALNSKGIELASMGDKVRAIACYDKALEIKPDYHQALYNKGNALDVLGHQIEAITCYDAVLEIKPDFHKALNNKGNAFYALGDKARAIACYDATLEIKYDFHEAFQNKGVVLAGMGDKAGALACYDAALEIKPDLYEAFYNKGVVLAELGKKAEAIACYSAALRIKPDYHQAWDNKGYTLTIQGCFDEAIICFDKAIEINSRYANAIYNKAFAVTKLNNLDEAVTLLQKAIEQDPTYRDIAKTDPDFDSIRHDERFRSLVEGE